MNLGKGAGPDPPPVHPPGTEAAPSPVATLRDSPLLVLHSGISPTRFGLCHVGTTAQGQLVCSLTFHDDVGDAEAAARDFARDWPEARILPCSRHASLVAQALTEDWRSWGDWRPAVCGASAFGIAVWQAAARIPFGRTCSYRDVAASLGKPSASRAVGQALSRNPVALLIPCHRIVPASGDCGNYRWGSSRKRLLLEWEASHGNGKQDPP